MIPLNSNRTTTVWPLADLFDALRRNGFHLRPDGYVEIVQVLDVFKPDSYADLQALIAPLVVTSDEEQEQFDRIFDQIRREERILPQVVEPKSFPWKWPLAALLIVLILGYIAFFWPGPAFKTAIYWVGAVGPVEVGDTLIFSVDSSMQRAAGPLARWQWEKPGGQPYSTAGEPTLRVPAKQAGPLVVTLRSQRGRGLLITSWTDSLRSVDYPVCEKLPVVQIDSVRLAPLRYRFRARLTDGGQQLQRTQWQLNGREVARNQAEWEHTFAAGTVPSYYDIRFVALRDTTQRLCFGEASLTVGVQGTAAPPFTLDVRQTGALISPERTIPNSLFWAGWLVGGLLALLLGIYSWLVFRKSPEEPPPATTNPLAKFASDKPPFDIPLEKPGSGADNA